jgi:uncharacterized membrane protein
MTQKEFSIGEALEYGWNTMKTNFGFFIGIIIVSWIVAGIPTVIAVILQENAPGISFLFRLAGIVLSTIIQIGIIRIALKFVDGQTPEFNDLFTSFKGYFWRYLGASILFGLIVAGGMLLLIVPGIIWAVKFQYFTYLIIDQNLGVMDSLKKSSDITNGVKWPLFGFAVLLVLINYGGAVLLFIGLLATIPITMMANVSVYRLLLAQTTANTQTLETPQQSITAG